MYPDRVKIAGLAFLGFGLSALSSAQWAWAKVSPEGGRHVELFYAVDAKDATSALPLDASLVQVLEAGRATKLEAPYRILPTRSAPAYIVEVTKGDAVTYAKAVDSAFGVGAVVGRGLEIVGRPTVAGWDLRVLSDGKPVTDAEFVQGTEAHELSIPAKEAFSWPGVEAAGIRVRRVVKRAGKAPLLQWATIMLPALPPVPAGADGAAYRSYQLAVEGRETVSPATRPFVVPFEATNGSLKIRGEATWNGAGQLSIAFPKVKPGDPEYDYLKHVRGQVTGVLMRRFTPDFAQGDGKTVIVPGTEETNALGRPIRVADRAGTTYRIDADGRIREALRGAGERRTTVSYLEFQPTEGGRYLVRKYRQANDHEDLTYSDDFVLWNGEWMAKGRKVGGKHDGETLFMQVTFGEYRGATPAAGSR